MTFRIAEPTLSPEVANLLETFLGCKVASEGVITDRKQFDFFCIIDSYKLNSSIRSIDRIVNNYSVCYVV